MKSFKLNFDQKILRFWKMTLENLKIGKLSVTLAILDFQEFFETKFESKSS